MTDSSVEAVARAKELAEVTDLAKFASRREQQFFRERNALIVALKQIKIKAIKIADKDYSDPRMLKLQSEIREIIDEVLASSPDKPLDDKQIMRELQPSREVQDRIRREQEANAVGAHAVQNMPFGSCDKGMPCPGQRSDGRPVYCSPECAARAALPSPEREPMRWQPIESAPMHTLILVAYHAYDRNLVSIVQRTGTTGNWGDFDYINSHHGEPKYWMPLPVPPNDIAGPDCGCDSCTEEHYAEEDDAALAPPPAQSGDRT